MGIGGLPRRFVPGVEQGEGLGVVTRAQAGLLARLPVLAVIDARALKEKVPLIHKRAFAVMNREAAGRRLVSP